MVSKKSRQVVRENKHRRMRNRFSGTPERPRLAGGLGQGWKPYITSLITGVKHLTNHLQVFD